MLGAALGLSGLSRAAAAGPTAQNYVVDGAIAPDGTLSIRTTITLGPDAPTQLVQRLATTRNGLDYTTYTFDIRDIRATSDGTDLAPTITRDGNDQVITIDTARANGRPITISYQVLGAALRGVDVQGQERMTTVEWQVLQGLNVGVDQLSGELRVVDAGGPAQLTDVDCKAGSVGALTTCTTIQAGTFENPNPAFTDGPLSAGQVVDVTVRAPENVIAPNQMLGQRWTLDRAFSAAPVPLGSALGVLAAGGLMLWGAYRRFGRDVAGVRQPVSVARWQPVGPGKAEFVMLQDIRPGEIGTVADEHVDPADITATLLDLAIRGYLRIVELPRASAHQPLDWHVERLPKPTDELRAYELDILEAVAPEGGRPVRVSQLRSVISPVAPGVQDRLYDAVVARGWFAVRPDAARDRWTLAGRITTIVAALVLLVLVAFTRFGLVGLAFLVVGLGLVSLASRMPRRTPAGAALLAGLQLFASDLQTQPTDQAPKHRAYQEISKVLPYAVVLGGLERWLDALAAADDDPGVSDPGDLGWYEAPSDWNLSDLPDSMRGFITSVEGQLYGRG